MCGITTISDTQTLGIIRTVKNSIMRYLLLFAAISILSCNQNTKDMEKDTITTNSAENNVREFIDYNYNFFDKNDLSDNGTFDRYKALFSDSFVLISSEGKPLSNKETVLEKWRKLFKVNKAKFDLTIDRIEVSGDMAYAIYHYHEKLTNIESGELYFEVTQSAIAILKKNSAAEWKFEVLKYH